MSKNQQSCEVGFSTLGPFGPISPGSPIGPGMPCK